MIPIVWLCWRLGSEGRAICDLVMNNLVGRDRFPVFLIIFLSSLIFGTCKARRLVRSCWKSIFHII